MILDGRKHLLFAVMKVINVIVDKRKERLMRLDDKQEKNYQKFISELEKISKKYGIAISACGCFYYDDGVSFQEIEYRRDSSSGDLNIDKLIFSDGESLH